MCTVGAYRGVYYSLIAFLFIQNITKVRNRLNSKENKSLSKKILVLAANPKNALRLRLDHEVRDIEGGLQRAQRRDEFVLKQQWATRPQDIRRAMLDFGPNIVHFCGHGKGDAGIVVENEIILELKSVAKLVLSHEVQLVNYLAASNIELGLLINFGERRVDVKRKVKTL